MGRVNFKLIASACTVNLLTFSAGNAYSWSSTVLTDLRSDDPQRNPLRSPVTAVEESLITSLVNFGAVCGAIIAGYLSQKFGRKKTLLTFAVPMFMSQIILAFATTPAEFYVARIMLGLGVGCTCTVAPIYVGEIAETTIRGFLGCILGIMMSLGLLFVYVVGPFVTLKTLSFILMIPIGLFIILLGFFVPESPYYYVTVGDEFSAESSLSRLRNDNFNAKELAAIKNTVDQSKVSKVTVGELWKSRSFRKGIIITVTLMVFQQGVGITIILSYMEQIFIAAGSSLPSSTSTVIVALLQTITVLVTSILADRWGRKLLLAVASGGMCLPLFALGLYFSMKYSGDDVTILWWLPVLSLVLYMISYNLAFSALIYALIGELFSSKTKSLASTITIITCYSLSFLTSFVFPTLEVLLGLHVIFWILCAFSIFSLLFVLWYVPETKGKTFIEISEILER